MRKIGLFVCSIFFIGTIAQAQDNLLSGLEQPILFEGDAQNAFRDPAVVYHDGVFHLYFTWVEIQDDGKIFSYTAQSRSQDLKNWSKPEKITPKGDRLNYSSPGNVIRFGKEWVMCLQTYPRPGYTQADIPKYGDSSARIFIMRSKDLKHWSAPELLRVKGDDIPESKMGRMIDPYLIEDKDEPDKYWCFYKQNGVSMSWSHDLKHWTYAGHTESGENVTVLVEDDTYLLVHSPHNGIAMKRSKDLQQWKDFGSLITLGQSEWPWAQGRITAATIVNMKNEPMLGKYLMFFHGSGPKDERWHFDNHSSIGIAWSSDLQNWSWPGKE